MGVELVGGGWHPPRSYGFYSTGNTSHDIIIEDQRFTIRDGVGNNEKNARFTFDWDNTVTGTKTYQLPDPGIAVITSELIDDVSTQNLSAKTLIDGKLASTTATDAPTATFDTLLH